MQINISLLLTHLRQQSLQQHHPEKAAVSLKPGCNLYLHDTPRQQGQQTPTRNGHPLTQDPSKNLSHSVVQCVFRLAPHTFSTGAKGRLLPSRMPLPRTKCHSPSQIPAASLPDTSIPRSYCYMFSELLSEVKISQVRCDSHSCEGFSST